MKYYLLLLFCLPLQALAQTLLIKDVNVLDVEKRKIVPGVSVLVSNGKIDRIAPFKKLSKANADTVIEANGQYLMPGMMDAHIHFFQSGGLYTRPDAVDFRELVSYKEEIQFGKDNAADYLKRYLSNGITTVMDVGGPLWNFTVRDSVAKTFNAPNVLVTGPLFSMVSRPKMDEGDPPIIKVTTKEEVLALFNKQLAYRPDFIKIWYVITRESPAEKTYPLVEYLGELCREHNLKLAVHATQLKTARLAVKAGASILVHSIDDAMIPQDFVSTLKEKEVTVIPTLTVNKGYIKTFTGKMKHDPQDLRWANPAAYNTLLDLNKIDTASWPPMLKRLYGQDLSGSQVVTDSVMFANLRSLIKGGVNVATGTDAGNIGTMHASSFLSELLAMQKAGLSNWDLIVNSTLNPAKGFGIGGEVGSVTAGKQADLVMLSENPLDDIRNINSISAVIKSGELLSPDKILEESPEQVVQRQVNAYNARDIDAFLATFAEDVKTYEADGKLDMEGHAAMRRVYGPMFKFATNLYCEIVNRIVINNTVIDQEKVRFGNSYINAVAIYKVKDGKIVEVKFVE